MEKVLFVVDMQEIYVGRGRNLEKYKYNADALFETINMRIAEYPPEEVFYFKSIAKGLGGIMGSMPKAGTHEAKFAEKLKVVGKNIYERSKPDVLSIETIVDFLRSRGIKQIEIVGVDGGGSIGQTVVTATNEYNINVIYDNNCIGTIYPDKEKKLREKFKKSRVTYR